jgi:AcrR family transcriptional regulator
MTGKLGRPPEDRLKRQQEIYLAVAPLIEEYGARRLTLRQAARAAQMSLGGLQHYFPTKRDLVLHALKPEAMDRICADFSARHTDLERNQPRRYLALQADFMARQYDFIRPAYQAAQELGPELARRQIEAVIDGRLSSCTEPVRHAFPECTEAEIHSMSRSLRRTFLSALIDRTVTPEELREEFLALFRGWSVSSPDSRRSSDRDVEAPG